MNNLRISFAVARHWRPCWEPRAWRRRRRTIRRPAAVKPNLSGLHDFDLRAGEWVAHHRRLKERLAGSHEWVEFDGTQSFRLLMDGYANEDENVLNLPGGDYKGVTLRAYDSENRAVGHLVAGRARRPSAILIRR